MKAIYLILAAVLMTIAATAQDDKYVMRYYDEQPSLEIFDIFQPVVELAKYPALTNSKGLSFGDKRQKVEKFLKKMGYEYYTEYSLPGLSRDLFVGYRPKGLTDYHGSVHCSYTPNGDLYEVCVYLPIKDTMSLSAMRERYLDEVKKSWGDMFEPVDKWSKEPYPMFWRQGYDNVSSYQTRAGMQHSEVGVFKYSYFFVRIADSDAQFAGLILD